MPRLKSPLYFTDISPITVPYIKQGYNKAIPFSSPSKPSPVSETPIDPSTNTPVSPTEELNYIPGRWQCGVTCLVMLINSFIIKKVGATSNKIITQANIPTLYADYDQTYVTTRNGRSTFQYMDRYNAYARAEILKKSLSNDITPTSFPLAINQVASQGSPVKYSSFIRTNIPPNNVGTLTEMYVALKYHRSPIICRTGIRSWGHYILIIGYNKTKDSFIVHDPFGYKNFDLERKSLTGVPVDSKLKQIEFHNWKQSGQSVLYKAQDTIDVMNKWNSSQGILSYMFIADWDEFSQNYDEEDTP